jgi:hypothetical protein
LTKTIQRLVQQANLVGLSGVDEPDRLLAEDMFFELAMEEGIGYVELFCMPTARCRDGESSPYSRRLDDRSKGLPEIDASTLSESSDHPTRFVPFQGAVGVELMTKHPFARHNVRSRWSINKPPCTIALKSLELKGHGAVPVRVVEGCASGGGNW